MIWFGRAQIRPTVPKFGNQTIGFVAKAGISIISLVLLGWTTRGGRATLGVLLVSRAEAGARVSVLLLRRSISGLESGAGGHHRRSP